MIDHVSTYTTQFAAMRAFYEAALAPLGFPIVAEMALDSDPDLPGRRICMLGPAGRRVFGLVESVACVCAPHLAFVAEDRRAVAAFHAAALRAGGRDNGAPGLRPEYHEHYFGAFALDPDGNNVEAVCHQPETPQRSSS